MRKSKRVGQYQPKRLFYGALGEMIALKSILKYSDRMEVSHSNFKALGSSLMKISNKDLSTSFTWTMPPGTTSEGAEMILKSAFFSACSVFSFWEGCFRRDWESIMAMVDEIPTTIINALKKDLFRIRATKVWNRCQFAIPLILYRSTHCSLKNTEIRVTKSGLCFKAMLRLNVFSSSFL